MVLRLRIAGGFLGGTELEFADGLNCLIGGRGTGKTTALEFLRFGLGLMPDPKISPQRHRTIEGLVKANLAGSRLSVELRTKTGMNYTAQRGVSEAVQVTNEAGTPVPVALDRDQIFSADVFSQNEIEEIASNPAAQIDLLDRFVDNETTTIARELELLNRQLDQTTVELRRLDTEIDELVARASELSVIEERLKGVAQVGGADAAKINAAHTNKSARDREAQVPGQLASAVQRAMSETSRADPHRAVVPRYWLPLHTVEDHLGESKYFLAYRDAISATADARSLAACYLGRVPSVHTLLLVRLPVGLDTVPFAAGLNSFPLDYVLRQKATGAHAARFIMRQLPFLGRDEVSRTPPWAGETLLNWLLPRVLELSYTDWELEPFARDLGYAGPPFRWHAARRFVLRCEIDAAFFHLYSLTKDEVAYVMESFPVVRRSDEKAHGEYRTKRVILEIYDALTKAAETCKPYRTVLDPPPAAPGASHGVFAPEGTPRDYAEALRLGVLFTLIRRSGVSGTSYGLLSRALLWLEDAKHAATWLEGAAFAEFEGVRESDPLLVQGLSNASTLLQALEGEKAITRDAKGVVRLRIGGTVPSWLPQTPLIAKLANVMQGGLEQAEADGSANPAIEIEKASTGKAKGA